MKKDDEALKRLLKRQDRKQADWKPTDGDEWEPNADPRGYGYGYRRKSPMARRIANGDFTPRRR